MRIDLPCGRTAWIDDDDAPLLEGYSLCSDVRRHTAYVRCWRTLDGKRDYIYLHHIISGYRKTDHKDGNGLNNRRANLRPCTNSQNCFNSAKKRAHKTFKGVYFESQRQKWRARIRVNSSTIDGGFFASEEAAARAYDALAIKHHGKFARLNFTESTDK